MSNLPNYTINCLKSMIVVDVEIVVSAIMGVYLYLIKKDASTNQPERLHSLYSMLEAVQVCLVAFEIFERLKTEYGFEK